jgi:hypothetical protein
MPIDTIFASAIQMLLSGEVGRVCAFKSFSYPFCTGDELVNIDCPFKDVLGGHNHSPDRVMFIDINAHLRHQPIDPGYESCSLTPDP